MEVASDDNRLCAFGFFIYIPGLLVVGAVMGKKKWKWVVVTIGERKCLFFSDAQHTISYCYLFRYMFVNVLAEVW